MKNSNSEDNTRRYLKSADYVQRPRLAGLAVHFKPIRNAANGHKMHF
jgi:hypothetical protein